MGNRGCQEKYVPGTGSCCDESCPAWAASRGKLFPVVGAAEAVPRKLCLPQRGTWRGSNEGPPSSQGWSKRAAGVVEGAGLARTGKPTAACSSLRGSCKDEGAETFLSEGRGGGRDTKCRLGGSGWALSQLFFTRQVVQP